MLKTCQINCFFFLFYGAVSKFVQENNLRFQISDECSQCSMHPEATAPQNVSNKTERDVFSAQPFTLSVISGYFDSYLLFSKYQQPHFLRSWCSLRIGGQGFNLLLASWLSAAIKTFSSEFCPKYELLIKSTPRPLNNVNKYILDKYQTQWRQNREIVFN